MRVRDAPPWYETIRGLRERSRQCFDSGAFRGQRGLVERAT